MTKTMGNTNVDMVAHVPPGQLAAQGDQNLVSAATVGSDDAFAELKNLYSQRLYSTIVRITKNHEDAQEVLQDTFLRGYLALCSFEGRSIFYCWVTRIAINCAPMVLRKRRARFEASLDLLVEGADDLPHIEIKDSSPNPEQILHEAQLWVSALCSIQNLEPKLQETIQIHLARGCSMKEIARTLGVSIASVKSRPYRERVRLGFKGHFASAVGKLVACYFPVTAHVAQVNPRGGSHSGLHGEGLFQALTIENRSE